MIKPQLKAIDLTFIVVSLVIGMGIFRTPAEVAARAGTQWIFFLAWLTGAVVSYAGALVFAEIGSRHPVAGGFYKIFSICYSPVFAFMVNWIIVISNGVSTAAVAIMGAEYMAPLIFPGMVDHDSSIRVVSIASLALLYGINMLGIRVSAKLITGLMVLKLLLLTLMIFTPVILYFTSDPITTATATPAPTTATSTATAFLLCFIPVFFTYGGYQQTMNFGGDVKHPRKTMPRAIAAGMGIVLVVYLLVNVSYVAVLGFEGLQHSTTLAADMIGRLWGDNAHKFVSVMMFLSVMTFVNVSLISNPRVYYAMAEDKVMPAIFHRVNPRTQVQEFGVTFFCIVILVVLFYLSSFQRLLGFVMFFDSISLIAAAGAIFILRRREVRGSEVPALSIGMEKLVDNPSVQLQKNISDLSNEVEGSEVVKGSEKKNGKNSIFKLKGYPWLPVFFILIYFGVTAAVMISYPQIFFGGSILFVLGFPLYYLVQSLITRKGRAS